MSLSKSLPDSNAPDSGASRPNDNGNGSGPGAVGYSVVSFPSQKPARSNADVSTTTDFSLGQVNEGTSMGSYDEQPEKVSAETGS